MASSSSNIEEISASDSIDLLRTEQVGRVGVTANGRPEIFPVSYSLDASNSILFRTGVGTKSAAVNHEVVFEVDRGRRREGDWVECKLSSTESPSTLNG